MTFETIGREIKLATEKLLQMTRELCWNRISNNCFYILTNKEDIDLKNATEIRRIGLKRNKKKIHSTLNQVISKLQNQYSNLYDLDLYLYKSEKNKTIIEIQYLLKSALYDASYVIKKEPMITCKVILPAYADDRNAKFNANWQFGSIEHSWKMFNWKLRMRKK